MGKDTTSSRALRATVQRRDTSTRREMFRQLAPQATPVSQRLLRSRNTRLQELGAGCVYCGQNANTMDHLEPLVKNGMPTGLIPTILDMLPCCSRCNSSKGAHSWRVFMKRMKWKSNAHTERIKWLAEYDKWRRRHAQRWSVQKHAVQIAQLNTMVNECHAFMQNMVNQCTASMHGKTAVQAYAKKNTWNWQSIQCQMMGHA